MSARAASLLVVLVFAAAPALAGDDPDARWVEASVAGQGGIVHRAATGGADVLLAAGGWGARLALCAPLRFDASGLRRRDWDELSDFGRIVADAGYGRPGDDLSIHLQPVGGFSLGTGDLVSLYASTADPDHWRTGLAATLHWDPAGADLFVDSFLWPSVLGGRAYLRPLHWVAPGGTLARLEIGGTFVADLRAPHGGPATAARRNGLPDLPERRLWAGGLDLRWPVFRVDEAEITPYAAWSRLGTGMGWHVGLALEVAPTRAIRVRLAGEWRHLGAGYVSSYFDGLYAADRHDFDGTGTKADALTRADRSRMGMMAGLGFEVRPWTRGWVVLDLDALGRFNQVRGGLAVRVPEVLDLTFTATARGFPRASDLAAPGRRVAAVVAEVPAWKGISVFGSYARDLAGSDDPAAPGAWRPSDTFWLGVRAGLAWADKH